MATHSSIVAWRSPWTEEPGGYSPWGRKELDTTKHEQFIVIHTVKKKITVSELTSTRAAALLSSLKASFTSPSAAILPAFLAALASPFSLR